MNREELPKGKELDLVCYVNKNESGDTELTPRDFDSPIETEACVFDN